MENNKGLVIGIIILGVLVVIMGGYIGYDVISESGANKKLENNNIVNKNENQEKEKDIKNEDDNNDSVSSETSNECQYTEIDYSDLNDMGTGIIIESIGSYNEDGIDLNLYSNGKLYYVKRGQGINSKKEIPVSDVIKIVSTNDYDTLSGQIFYMLNKDGQIYNVYEKDIIDGNVTPKLVTGVPKFVDIGTWNTAKPNAGGGSGVFGITAEGKAHPVTFGSL